MALLLGFRKNNEGGTIDACAQLYSLASGSLLDTLKHPFDNGIELSSVDYSPQHRCYFAVEQKANHIFGWSLQRKNRKYLSYNIGSKAHIICVSTCGSFCAVAVGPTIYVWQVSNGNVICVLSGHFQPISAIAFTGDSRLLLSAGEDGLILVWDLVNCISIRDYTAGANGGDQNIPLYKWTDHSQAVTGIAVGKGGLQSRVFSCSKDHSFRIWDLLCGRLLLSIVFDIPLTALAVDTSETRAFVSAETGRIIQINLFAPPQSASIVKTSSMQTFDGHQSACHRLAVSMDGLTLISIGSTLQDRHVRIWDVASLQCLRTIKLKGEAMDMRLLNKVPTGYENESNSSFYGPAIVMLKPFQRSIVPPKLFSLMASGLYDGKFQLKNVVEDENFHVIEDKIAKSCMNDKSLSESKLTETNKKLYEFVATRILSGDIGGRTSSADVGEDVIIVENSGGSGDEGSSPMKVRRKSPKTIAPRRSLRHKKANAKRRGRFSDSIATIN